MRFVETSLPGVVVIEPELLTDERGWFARTFDREEFAAHGMNPEVIQTNASFNVRAGTLRGMHYQAEPHGESKLVRCVRGAIFDVALDLRAGSPTHGRWHAAELSAENGLAFYIPAGLAHGFQTLADESEVHYVMGDPHVPEAARGVRWDDPAFGIEWPPAPPGGRVISERDRSYPDYEPSARL
ncbi:MAG TPA: dTDP-4-dehydrorhamnose 3,5-epimerase [Solirubrobacteraceae bacterium]|jgi:dTDP-4-dehydrorhamnose 3,5-epimerase|nr:dTDP-4-dehydrorhamnose 3,5-epimerase [Solirubrobacteraceae bacterium]